MWQAFWAIGYKELVQALRDKNTLRRLVVLQLLDLIMLAWLDVSVRNVPAVIVDQDHTSESRELLARLEATHTFKMSFATSSTEQARNHIRAGRAKVAFVIPADYGRLRASGGNAQVLALIDGSDSVASAQVASALEGVASRLTTEARQELVQTSAEVTTHPKLLYNPQGSVSFFMLPGMLALILGHGYSFFAMTGITKERDGGNLERLLMTPMDYRGLILGKLVPWFLMGILNSFVYVIVIHVGFGVPIRGSVALLSLVIVLYVLTVLSFGSFIASGAKTGGGAQALWGLIIFPVTLLSGYIFPISSLPKALLPITYALPHTHFIEVMRAICLRGATASELGVDLVYLTLAPILFTVGAARRFARTVMQ